MDRQGAWRAYPYVLSRADPELTFPAAEGDQGAESNTYYVAGRLRGRATQRPQSVAHVLQKRLENAS